MEVMTYKLKNGVLFKLGEHIYFTHLNFFLSNWKISIINPIKFLDELKHSN